MAILRAGYLQTRSFPSNYWHERYQYFPAFEQNPRLQPEPPKPIHIIYDGQVVFKLSASSNVKFSSAVEFIEKETVIEAKINSLDDLLILDDDLWLSMQ